MSLTCTCHVCTVTKSENARRAKHYPFWSLISILHPSGIVNRCKKMPVYGLCEVWFVRTTSMMYALRLDEFQALASQLTRVESSKFTHAEWEALPPRLVFFLHPDCRVHNQLKWVLSYCVPPTTFLYSSIIAFTQPGWFWGLFFSSSYSLWVGYFLSLSLGYAKNGPISTAKLQSAANAASCISSSQSWPVWSFL